MCKIIFLFFVFLLLAAFVDAQSTNAPGVKKDSTFLLDDDNDDDTSNSSGFAKEVLSDTTINFSDFTIQNDTLAALKLRHEYRWISNIDSFLLAQKKEDSEQAKIVIKQNSGKSFLNYFFNSGILQTIMWVAVAALILFIIYRLFLSEGLFGIMSAKAGVNVQTDEDDVRLVDDYEILLRKSYTEGNWRFAMRFLFLKTLRKLSEQSMIVYAVDKTNSMYINEIPLAKRNEFVTLAHYYEYIWYGNIEIEKTVFDNIENKFNSFLSNI